MVVAFDLRPLQSGHQFRGIGIALHNILLELSKNPELVKDWEIVYYVDEGRELPAIMQSQTLPGRVIKARPPRAASSSIKLIRRLKFLTYAWSKMQAVNKLPELDKVDIFIQFDFLMGLPKNAKAKNVLVKYDIIPLVMERYYLPTYAQVKARTGKTKTAIKARLHRWRYLYSLRNSLARSDLILAISKQTKKDLQDYLNVPANKIEVLYLAADEPPAKDVIAGASPKFKALEWRFLKGQSRLRNLNINDAPYLLYIGGADPRRRIQDLVTAFNRVRAAGVNCRLILVGFDFLEFEKIPSLGVQEAIRNSSYAEDIYLLGFVDPGQKFMLYKNARAFVYPTVYEGFGLPVLEAMGYGCPIVCYKNSSLQEVGGSAALYADNPDSIAEIVIKLIRNPEFRNKTVKTAHKQAKKFSWQKTTSKFIEVIGTLETKG